VGQDSRRTPPLVKKVRPAWIRKTHRGAPTETKHDGHDSKLPTLWNCLPYVGQYSEPYASSFRTARNNIACRTSVCGGMVELRFRRGLTQESWHYASGYTQKTLISCLRGAIQPFPYGPVRVEARPRDIPAAELVRSVRGILPDRDLKRRNTQATRQQHATNKSDEDGQRQCARAYSAENHRLCPIVFISQRESGHSERVIEPGRPRPGSVSVRPGHFLKGASN